MLTQSRQEKSCDTRLLGKGCVALIWLSGLFLGKTSLETFLGMLMSPACQTYCISAPHPDPRNIKLKLSKCPEENKK